MVHDHGAGWERGECGRGMGGGVEEGRKRRGRTGEGERQGRRGRKLFSHFHYESRGQIPKTLTTVLIMELSVMDRNQITNKYGIFFFFYKRI